MTPGAGGGEQGRAATHRQGRHKQNEEVQGHGHGTAASSQGFSQGGIRSSDWFSETLLRAHGALTSDRGVGRPRSGPPPIHQVRCREELV